MPGSLQHSPSDVLRNLLVELGLGVTPPLTGGMWPIFATSEPDSPDAVITIYDTTGNIDGRIQYSGEIAEHQGIQVRIRAVNPTDAYLKADAIKEALDKQIKNSVVSIDTATYLVYAVTRKGSIISLGKESSTSKKSVFTINAIITLRQTS